MKIFEVVNKKFYHGSYDKLEPGTVLTPKGKDYEAAWGGTGFYGALEKHRPPEQLAHKEGVFMVANPDDVDNAGGATDYIYAVVPMGEPQRHDMNWGTAISSLLDNGARLNDSEIKFAADQYWSGKPHPDGNSVWEFIAPRAKIAEIIDENKEITHEDTDNDLKDVADWMNTTPDNISVEVKQEPIEKFIKQIREMYGTYNEFPKDEQRTDRILKLLKQGAKPMPIYVEANDPDLFVMEGRHRMVAFWLAGMKTIPVAYVSVKTNENFADGKVKGKSRPGRVKRAGASCKGSVTDLRAKAKKYPGEKGKMYHWCANMKGGKKK